MHSRGAATFGMLATLVVLAGCGGGHGRSDYVTQVPRWDYQRYERIAVLPGRAAHPGEARDAGILADRLTTYLAQSGAFTVLSRAELAEVFAEQDLSRLTDAVGQGMTLPEGRIEIAQALVATKITDYKLIADREQHSTPRYARDRHGRVRRDRGGRPIVVGHDTYMVYTHGAEVEGSVRVVDAATGTILLSHSARVAARPQRSRGCPPGQSPEEMASEAVRELATDFYKRIAPTRIKVKFKSDMLIVATEYFDGRYEKTSKLSVGLSNFLLVVRDLKDGCDRNRFRAVIMAEEGRTNLFEEEFTWSGGYGPEGVSYRVPMEALTAAGGEKFVAKLYSVGTPEPLITREFEVVTEKGD